MKKLFLIGFVGLLLTSCMTGQSVMVKGDNYVLPESKVITTPYVADLNIQKNKATVECTWKSLSGTITQADLETAKNDALNKMLIDNNADVIVAPVFVIETKGSKINITASGYPATYTNFQKASNEKNRWMFDIYNGH